MSKISWTEKTWNPIVGCSIISPGCTNCYAMKMAHRICKMQPGSHYEGTTKKVNGNAVWTGKVALAPDNKLMEPLKRKKPTTYFVNSMGDLFHEDVPNEWIDKVFAVMALCPQHTFQVLTKRADRMYSYLTNRDGNGHSAICKQINKIPAELGDRRGALQMPLPNVHLGISAENSEQWRIRSGYLICTPAAVRWTSFEPQIEYINPDIKWMDWAVQGCESGPNRRPFDIKWARLMRDNCADTGVPYFLKQIHDDNGKVVIDPLLDGVRHAATPTAKRSTGGDV